jgi:dipeptidyl aminopeptidase/acylaminoacyl peptidase
MEHRLLLLLACAGTLGAEQLPPAQKALTALQLPRPLSSPDRRHDIKVTHDITVQDLLWLRSIGGLSISPDGKWVAFTLRQPDVKANRYRTALFVTATSGHEKPLNLGSVGPVVFNDTYYPVTIDPVWSQDSRYILYPMPEVGSNGEFGKSQLFRWSREGGQAMQLTHSPTSVLYAVGTLDGRILYSTFGKRPDLEALAKQYFDHGIWYFDLDGNPNSLGSISPSSPIGGSPDIMDQALHHMRLRSWEPATAQWLDDAPYEVHVLHEQSGKEQDATTEESKFYQKLADSHSIVSDWTTSLDDPSRVWVPGPAGAEISFQENPHNGADHSAPSNLKGHRLIYSVSRDGPKATQVSPSSDYSYSDCSYSTAGKRFACVRENPQTPPEIVSFNSYSSDEQLLTDLNPEVRTWKLPTVELVEWTDPKGNPGFGYLYKPVGFGNGPYPTIVLPYYSATYDFTETAVVSNEYPTYAFTSRGYAVLRPDMRFYMLPTAVGTSKKLWMIEGSFTSILSGLDHLVTRGISDRARVGIAGLSQGAKWTSYAIAHSNAFAAASVPYTAQSFNSVGAYYAGAQFTRDVNSLGDDGKVIDGLERAHADESQISSWADSVSAPLLVDASDGEWVQSVQAAIALKTRGKPVEMVVYPDARHLKKWPRQLESVWEMNLDWFDFWLRDARDPTPEKKEQYERWEKLKNDRVHTRGSSDSHGVAP